MKKVIITTVLIICGITHMSAQNNNVKLFEIEAGLGITTAGNSTSLWGYTNRANRIGANLIIEPRINIPGSSFDIGVQLNLNYFARIWGDNITYTYRFKNLAAYTDYNYRKWKYLHLFGGCGIGLSAYETEIYRPVSGQSPFTISYYDSFYLAPRVGVEVFNHLRLTVEYKFLRWEEVSNLNITVGFVFGGGRK